MAGMGICLKRVSIHIPMGIIRPLSQQVQVTRQVGWSTRTTCASGTTVFPEVNTITPSSIVHEYIHIIENNCSQILPRLLYKEITASY
ncbi:hypothetical protein K493DRAFT_313273 [Basidiobolus meristosporus CBS 931.73]|uniref:Uncharacterized protein n=1 Tax=Basidiobolus meristosporus CBS 931.73 TaxID=1314790 RepID=A0A1Y1YMZ1_9FUNG|nr:hypothetical protein K493DRAFT_313273 [Basidiobolus meristosporus CBS 931.73]|eukprot:ORX99338.1 hypothetical protein K493DRAFT_313273 [Basidiobolus meristosporus CBS 931.73]